MDNTTHINAVITISLICIAFVFIGLIWLFQETAIIEAEARDNFHREIACLESGRDWVKGVCK